MRVGRSQFCLSRDLVLCPPWKTHSIVRTTPVWKGHESECVWICLGSLESTHWDTDLFGANGRPCPIHGFLSSLSSWCFPGVCPSPSKALRRPSSSTCASDGQAPGERGSLSFRNSRVCGPGIGRAHLWALAILRLLLWLPQGWPHLLSS